MSVIEIKFAQKQRKKKRRKEILIRPICLLVVALGIVTWRVALCGAASGQKVPEYEYHTCDRLWDFLEYCPSNMDRWEYLEAVKELNGMDDYTVYSGKLYKVPMYK